MAMHARLAIQKMAVVWEAQGPRDDPGTGRVLLQS